MNEKNGTLIVVEGKTDIDFLSKFLDADFYCVNGSAINQDNYDFINEYLKKGKVIILTDPDYPGLSIRNKINSNCKGCYNAYVRKEVSIKHHKVGVAESTKEEVLNAINNAINYDLSSSISDLKEIDLIDLGLSGRNDSKEKRMIISSKYHLGYNNFKSLYKKLKILNISKEDIKETLENVKG